MMSVPRAEGLRPAVRARHARVAALAIIGDQAFVNSPDQLDLSTPASLFFDYMAYHRQDRRTASEIERDFGKDPFYRKHGKPRRFSRESVKAYANQVRQALTWAFEKAHLALDPYDVLKPKPPTEGEVNPDSVVLAVRTTSNEVRHQLRGRFEWFHPDPYLLREPSSVMKSWPGGIVPKNQRIKGGFNR